MKTPLLTRVRVARDIGLGGGFARPAITSSTALALTCVRNGQSELSSSWTPAAQGR
ncbi:protein of unknown function (plasmid) [Shinella sp. WSC3-e]|nr:protein of unknown function [Shinella sp. WSC3-e]